jgi:UDP-glucose 6-dehydrogenase
VDRVNEAQKKVLFEKIYDYFKKREAGGASFIGVNSRQEARTKKREAGGRKREEREDFSKYRIAVWGLAFKPRTDDMREAPSIVIIKNLREKGFQIVAYDPEAMKDARKIFGDDIEYAQSDYECLRDADALAIVTDWNEFRRPDFDKIRGLMKRPLIFDGRNLFDPERMKSKGFEYISIGR